MEGVWAGGGYRSWREGEEEPRDQLCVAAGRDRFGGRHCRLRVVEGGDVKLLAVLKLDLNFEVEEEGDD